MRVFIHPVVSPRRDGARRGASISLVAMVLGSVVLTSPSAAGATVCAPTTDSPVLTVDPGPVTPGETLRVEGTGWCHPSDGGSLVALKIDEGAYSRVDASLHPNQTIWALVEADPRDGTFAVDLELPDGTLATSTPQFVAGTHSLRALTGSLKPGDVPRTVESGDFVVGEHRPQGIPEPVAPTELRARNRGGVEVTRGRKKWEVAVPEGEQGDWVFLTLLAPDGSPRHVWGDSWWRLDRSGRVTVPTPRGGFQGAHRLVVQDGNVGHVGAVRGWARVKFPTASSTPAEKKTERRSHDTSGSEKVSRVTPSARIPATRSVSVPAVAPTRPVTSSTSGQVLPSTFRSPARTFAALARGKEFAARLKGDEVVVRTERADADLFVHVYDASSSVAGGWTRSDARGRVRLDVRDLPDGDYRVSLTGLDEELAGWAPINLASKTAGTPVQPETEVVPAGAAAASDPRLVGPADGWLVGIGLALLAGLGLGRLARKEGAQP